MKDDTLVSNEPAFPPRGDWLCRGADFATLDILQPAPVPGADSFPGKAIVICCDGTSNDPDEMDEGEKAPTNVYRLYKALTHRNLQAGRQVTWYDAGVGTGTSTPARIAAWFGDGFDWIAKFLPGWLGNLVPSSVSNVAGRVFKALEAATGLWIEENIQQGYAEIVRHYEPGDRIFIFGFSRGAYTARCIAGVIERCGLLKAENIRYVPDVMKLYRRRRQDAEPPLMQAHLIHPPAAIRIHVLGLWDTVASLGLPLWGWWFRLGAFWRSKTLDSNPAAICEHVYHALSMDERRSQFFPTMTTPAQDHHARGQYLRQVWLRGAHGDVGGTYANRGLGDIGLEWMLQIACHHGLQARADIDEIPIHQRSRQPICRAADPQGSLHNEMEKRKAWIVLGAWPRWAPVPRPAWTDRFQARVQQVFGAPHDLVYRRAALAAAAWRRRPAAQGSHPTVDRLLAQDGLIFLGQGDKLRVEISAATVWNRTAIVFETAASYRITYIATARSPADWQDEEKPLCGPQGQSPNWLDLWRHLFRFRRRLRSANWLELIGHIAHPRPWPVEEFGIGKLLQLLFWRDPKPLTLSLLRLGKYLPQPGASVDVINLASGGLFYCFANDVWPYYANNSGSVTIEIERVAYVASEGAYFVVTPRGEVLEHAPGDAAGDDTAGDDTAGGAPDDGAGDPLATCETARRLVCARNLALRDHLPGRVGASWPLASFHDQAAQSLPESAGAALPAYPRDATAFDGALQDRAAAARRQLLLPEAVCAIDDQLVDWWNEVTVPVEERRRLRQAAAPLVVFSEMTKGLTARAPAGMQPASRALERVGKAADLIATIASRPLRRGPAARTKAWAHGWDRDEV